MASATAKPNMPIAGAKIEPVLDTSTNKVPIIGPVHENDTNAKTKAIKRMLSMPDVDSALASNFVDHDDGSVISNAPKNEMAKTINNRKNRILKNALVDRLLSALAPNNTVIKIPKAT